MNSLLGLENLPVRVRPSPAPGARGPHLLVELEPWGRTFWRNLADVLWRGQPPTLTTTSPPGQFWPDVFVSRPLPWSAFAESLLYHSVVIALAWGLSSLFASRPQIATKARVFDPADVIYYSPSEYLPPIDTGKSHEAKPIKGEPVYAKQPSLSVPIAATESKPSQLPTLPSQIVAPVPDVNQAANRNMASLSQSIVAPPPDVDPGKVRVVASLAIDVVAPAPDATATGSRRLAGSVQSAIVEPPPAMNAASVRKLGDINIGPSDVIAPAPQLPVAAQRTLGGLGGGKGVVPPPPSLDASAG